MSNHDWLIGVGLAVVASFISNLGLNLQKLTHVKMMQAKEAAAAAGVPGKAAVEPLADLGAASGQADGPSERLLPGSELLTDVDGDTPYFRQRLWVVGFVLVVLGSLCDFAALVFAAQSIVAPLGSLTLLSNIYLAPFFSGEKVSATDVKATVLVVAGSAISVAFGSHAAEDYNFDELFGFFTRWKIVVYATFLVTTVSFLMSTFHYVDRIRDDLSVARHPRVLDARKRLKTVQRVALGTVAGIIGAQSVLFAKACAQLIRIGVLGLWLRWESYLCIAGLFLTIQGQVAYLNMGLKRYDALVIVPIFEAFWILFGTVSGLVVFDEADGYTRRQTLMFTLGICTTLAGVSILAGRSGSSNEDRYSNMNLLASESAADAAEKSREKDVLEDGGAADEQAELGGARPASASKWRAHMAPGPEAGADAELEL